MKEYHSLHAESLILHIYGKKKCKSGNESPIKTKKQTGKVTKVAVFINA